MPSVNPIAPFGRVALPAAKGLVFFKVSDILYFEADNATATLHFTEEETFGTMVIYKGLLGLEDQLGKHGFLLIRRNVLINTHNIKCITKDRSITMQNGQKFNPSRGKVHLFDRYIKEHFCT